MDTIFSFTSIDDSLQNPDDQRHAVGVGIISQVRSAEDFPTIWSVLPTGVQQNNLQIMARNLIE